VHWGQRNNLTMEQVEAAYPAAPLGALYRWRQALSALTRNGRFATFSTKFTRDRGLEVVDPQIQSFTVHPTDDCAGSLVHVTWTADDNPPGTVARLEILPAGSTTPTDPIHLGDLQGERDVNLPAGRGVFRLVVSYTLNGRTRETYASREVRGIQNHDTMTFHFTATCFIIGGQNRWGVQMAFGSSTSARLKVEEVECSFSNGSSWYMRSDTMHLAGLPDVKFSPSSFTQAIPTKPPLLDGWLFYLDDVGCLGVAPEVQINFSLICEH